MRLLSLISSVPILLIIQLASSIWFLSDFFVARDSVSIDSLRKNEKSLNEDILQLETLIKNDRCRDSYLSEPYFDKVVLIIIDAFGSQFLPNLSKTDAKQVNVSETMPFIQSLLRNGQAKGYVSKAMTPTVTMPRLKALISGVIPSFLDIIYNLAFDVSAVKNENIVSVAKANNKSIVFYGDDTWLSLVNNETFTRYKETLSLYASDYTSVDTNVSESAMEEISKDPVDWDYLILHFLGLDHIGHVFGSNNIPLIRKKLSEMDNIVDQIYTSMSSKSHRTLIVLTGDHGMTIEGNHGGDSRNEIDTSLVFFPINRRFIDQPRQMYSKVVKQIDFAATLSLLAGMPIPSSSLGIIIRDLYENLANLSHSDIACFYMANAVQIYSLTKTKDHNNLRKYSELLDIMRAHNDPNSDKEQISNRYSTFVKKIQAELITVAAVRSSSISIITCLIVSALLTLIRTRKVARRLLFSVTGVREKCSYILVLTTPILMQGSTDFIEFEPYLWSLFAFFSLVLISSAVISDKRHLLTGIDWTRARLFILTFILSSTWNTYYLQRNSLLAPFISLVILCNFLRQNSSIKKFKFFGVLLIGFSLASVKYVEESSENFGASSLENQILVQRLALAVVLIYSILSLTNVTVEPGFESVGFIQRISSSWLTFAFLLARKHNFLFFASNLIMETSLNSILDAIKMNSIARTLIYIGFAQAAFYNQGNTNLFPSIDTKPAFFAQTSFNIYIAIPMVAMATYSAQIYWYLKLFQRIQDVKIRASNDIHGLAVIPMMGLVRDFLLMRNYLSFSYLMFVCFRLRNHLFVWSVLSPKLVYHLVTIIIIDLVAILISKSDKLKRFQVEKKLIRETV